MPSPFENIQNSHNAAAKDRADASAGLRDILQADAQFCRGQLGFGDTLSQEARGFGRIVSGTIGNWYHSAVENAQAAQYPGVLPALELSDGRDQSTSSQSLSDGEIRQKKKESALYQSADDTETAGSDDIRALKKDKSAYLRDDESPDLKFSKLTIRQAKKEKDLYMQSQLTDDTSVRSEV
ncbi:MAG: hypothetical protein U0103_11115 [Candidatus Obscuribacterales bacterium]|jgi:hypothetical protein|nr:hypothetical protein [Cyanobacteria bacterium SZAS LIN-5]RTL44547.1 MAG: hypothetical protein EKK48_04665 [Candidatus Melainabacteria bacterium]